MAGISKSQPSAAPLVHAKLLLLGEAGEGEGDFGEQVLYFAPRKAWLGSANFTLNSRRSLESGLEDVHPVPERIPVEYDDEAMREALREIGPGPDDREWE